MDDKKLDNIFLLLKSLNFKFLKKTIHNDGIMLEYERLNGNNYLVAISLTNSGDVLCAISILPPFKLDAPLDLGYEIIGTEKVIKFIKDEFRYILRKIKLNAILNDKQ